MSCVVDVRRGSALVVIALLQGLSASCAQRAPQEPTLEVSPSSTNLVTGQTFQLDVRRQYVGGPNEDVTQRAVYVSANRNVVTVDKGVLLAGAEAGSTTVRISDPASNAVATVSVVVTLPRVQDIEVAPPNALMRVGVNRSFSATGRLQNGVVRDMTNEVTWSSSDESIARVEVLPPRRGVVLAVARGDVTISATDPTTNTVGHAVVHVRGDEVPRLLAIRVTPNPATIFDFPGATVPFRAFGAFADGSEDDITLRVGWSSSQPAVATIDAAGVASSVSVGETTITATAAPEVPDGGAASEPVKGSAALRIP